MIIGLTGQTGAGKSTLSGMFAGRGVPVINADAVARETMEHSRACLMDLVLEFSTEVIHPDATLNREKLAEIGFSDRAKLKRLNEITYPYIIAAIMRKIEEISASGAPMLLLDAPTLFESGLDKKCDWIVAVTADREVRLRRIIARDVMTEEAAERRVSAQNRDGFYTSRADDILTNDGDQDELRLAFSELYARLERLAADGAGRRARAAEPEAVPADGSGAETEADGGEDPDDGGFEELTGTDE